MSLVFTRDDVRDPDRQWHDVEKPKPLAIVMRAALLNALAYTNGHQREASRLLGLTPRQMGYHMVRAGIPTSQGGKYQANSTRYERKKP